VDDFEKEVKLAGQDKCCFANLCFRLCRGAMRLWNQDNFATDAATDKHSMSDTCLL